MTSSPDEGLALAGRVGVWSLLGATLLGTLATGATAAPDSISVVGGATTATAALLSGGLAVLLRTGRHTWGWVHVLVLLATVNTTVSMATSAAGPGNPASLFFLWICLYAYFFLDARQARAHGAVIVAGLSISFAVGDSVVDPVAQWLLLVGTCLGAGEMVRWQQERLNALRDKEAQRARTDHLTELPNRRAFIEMASAELARAQRTDGDLTVALMDLDHFKAVNDRHGHAVGDEVLCRVAALVRANLRPGDLAARWGGEEFALMLSPGDPEGARAEHVLQSIRADPEMAELRCTASIGLAQFPGDGDTLDELLRAADAGLYRAKRTGRDRVGDAETAPAPAPA